MRALEAFIERLQVDSERRHREMMASLSDEREQSREEYRVVIRALEALIERTAPSA